MKLTLMPQVLASIKRIIMVNPGLVLYTDTSTEYSTIFIQESDCSQLSCWFLCLCNSYTKFCALPPECLEQNNFDVRVGKSLDAD
ncbi:hypothetical protein HOLleu_28052 [Holothuria leucospilota]|uniref:Uncharacterized protein n=1 Tax=Holothuria leucospilota TaxID=206669 RepID=A0A9Q1H194_HOLLE|nr:hypothetical protein HOLleu_28052 [Holothuria leucospilota]